MVPHAVFCVVEEIGDLLGGFEGGEDVGEEGGVVAAAGFEDEFAGCGALDLSRISDMVWPTVRSRSGNSFTSSLMLVMASLGCGGSWVSIRSDRMLLVQIGY